MRMTSTVRHRLTNIVARAQGQITCTIDHEQGAHVQMKMANGSFIQLWLDERERAELALWCQLCGKDDDLSRRALAKVNNKHSGGTV
jgi:hypothetical protein